MGKRDSAFVSHLTAAVSESGHINKSLPAKSNKNYIMTHGVSESIGGFINIRCQSIYLN